MLAGAVMIACLVVMNVVPVAPPFWVNVILWAYFIAIGVLTINLIAMLVRRIRAT